MRLFVTGSSGFIGLNLIIHLIKQGHIVTGYDVQTPPNSMIRRNFHFVCGDISNEKLIQETMISSKPDLVIHLAAKKIPRYGNRLATLQVNGKTSDCIFEFTSKNGIGLIFASTSDVYGVNPDLPFSTGSHSVFGSASVARWAYAISKLYSEHLAHGYYEVYGSPTVIIRFFGAYGPLSSANWTAGPVPVFIEASLKREAIPLHGGGIQTRTFSYVDDHVRAISALISNWPLDSIRTLNFGSTQELSIRELGQIIWELVNEGHEAQFKEIPYSSFGKYEDVVRRVPDMTETFQSLGNFWDTPLRSGLVKTIDWHRTINKY